MKQISGIILLACLTIPFLGTYSWLHIQRSAVRKEVKEMLIAGMHEEDLTLLKLTNNQLETDLHWEHAKEFEYRGQKYDVVKRRQANGITYLWCWADKKETKLDQQLDNLVAHILGNKPQSRENQRRLINFLTNLYHFNSQGRQTLLYLESVANYSSYSFSYANIFHAPPVPPPELG